MNILFFKKLWQKFKTEPDVWFFYGFLLTFTLSIRKVLKFYPIEGRFNEYTGIYLYLSDLFLIACLLLFILYNKYSILSIYRNVPRPSTTILKNVPRGTLVLPFILVIWSFISIIWSDNALLALFRSVKLLELYFLFLYQVFKIRIVPCETIKGGCGTFLKNLFEIVIFVAVIQSIIGILQIALQHSVGFFWLKESLISPTIVGVAKLDLFGGKFIRAYGLFPHSNILGGFLLLSIILTYYYKKLFHGEQFWKKVLLFALFVQSIALILTFSKSAIIGLLVVIVYILFHPPKKRTSVEHQHNKKERQLFHMEHFWEKLVLILIIILLLFYIFKPAIYSNLEKSLSDRLFYIDVSRGTILHNWAKGIGNGQFVLLMPNYYNNGLLEWQHQPVHNVFLLIWSELGIIGLILFLLILWKMFHQPKELTGVEQSKETKMFHVEHLELDKNNKSYAHIPHISTVYKGILVGFIFIMLFDHYFWDIQQGQFMLWIVLGVVVATQKTDSDSG